MFLIAVILYLAPSLAAVIILFRQMQTITMTYIMMVCLFADMEMNKKVVADSSNWKNLAHCEFAKVNITATVGVTILSMCDVTIAQRMPWKENQFHRGSKGFPTVSLLCVGLWYLSYVPRLRLPHRD